MHFRLTDGKVKTRLELKFEPRDLWVGLYWDRETTHEMEQLHLYFCLLPTLLIHLCIWKWKEEI